MKGFKNPFSALIFCTVFEEIRQYFRMKNKSRSERRGLIAPRIQAFNKLITLAAWNGEYLEQCHDFMAEFWQNHNYHLSQDRCH